MTVHREAGFRFVIYADDHSPPHVHVLGAGEAKLVIDAGDARPEIVYAIGMARNDLRRVFRIVEQRRETLLADWTRIHG